MADTEHDRGAADSRSPADSTGEPVHPHSREGESSDSPGAEDPTEAGRRSHADHDDPSEEADFERADGRPAIGEGEAPPISPARRRLSIIIAFLFLAGILLFLVWFIAANTERNDGGGMFGAGPAFPIRTDSAVSPG